MSQLEPARLVQSLAETELGGARTKQLEPERTEPEFFPSLIATCTDVLKAQAVYALRMGKAFRSGIDEALFELMIRYSLMQQQWNNWQH